MTNFITLSCPSCGGQLKITPQVNRFACAYCGTEHLVKRDEGIVFLEPVLKAIEGVQNGVARVENYTQKAASELALPRLRAERESFAKSFQSSPIPGTNILAWLGFWFLGSVVLGKLYLALTGSETVNSLDIVFTASLLPFIFLCLSAISRNRKKRSTVSEANSVESQKFQALLKDMDKQIAQHEAILRR